MKVAGVGQSSGLLLDQEIKQKSVPGGREISQAGVRAQSRGQKEDQAEIVFSPEVLHEAVDKANHTLEVYGTELRFSLHEASGEMIVRVINTEDESVIREIPPERVLDFVANVKEMLGFIIDKLI